MNYSWSEIRARAAKFADNWKGAAYEKGETQTFYNDFFDVFGVPRRRVATFEERVKQLGTRNPGFIDLFWKGTLLVEQKSAGRDLKKARKQAFDYLDGLKDEELPRYLLLSDFQNFELLDLNSDKEVKFSLSELPGYIEEFGFIIGTVPVRARSSIPANITASERVAALHDALLEGGFGGHDLEQFLVRLVFCLFADDTGIFERGIFQDFVEATSRSSDLGPRLLQLFEVLNTPIESRPGRLSEELKAFPYINGDLFRERLALPAFDDEMQTLLVEAGNFHWEEISPAIFGAMFQSVMDKKKRRELGAHYTSEENILKALNPLCLEELQGNLGKIKALKGPALVSAAKQFQGKLAQLRFLDPACGCGNFLVIAYREVRLLELEVIKLLSSNGALVKGEFPSKVDVDQFYGIEILEFPVRITQVAMWMTDHIMNQRMSHALGVHFERFPLSRSANILHADALELPWESLIKPTDSTYVIGNPPYAGSKQRKPKQSAQVSKISGGKNTLDYVSAWLFVAAKYIEGCAARICFVTVNSITQGEQAPELWPSLFECDMEIEFAHRPFDWDSDAPGESHVFVVILGLCHTSHAPKSRRLFDYADPKGHPKETKVSSITPYLLDGSLLSNPHVVIQKSNKPSRGLPEMRTGSKPIDDGHYIFSTEQKDEFVRLEPGASKYIRPFIGAEEFLYGKERWILALHNISPEELRRLPLVRERVERVQNYRLGSKAESTRKIPPTRYHLNVLPSAPFLVVPEVSSESREYVPIGWLEPPAIPSNLVKVVENAKTWQFGLLTSKMHMAWLSQIGGRLENRYRYSIGIVYNPFPWPDLSLVEKAEISKCAEEVLSSRLRHASACLADLYDRVAMPVDLRRAHQKLDDVVDRAYRKGSFSSERERAEFLVHEYEARRSKAV